jgi:hypothetical protein
MLKLTQTVLDVADCNITPHYLTGNAADSPLPFASAQSYDAFYQSIAAARKTKYADVRKQEGAAIDQLRGAFSPNRFWERYLGSKDEETYARDAWENIVPLAATWKQTLSIVLPLPVNVTVRPQPLVLLYPFGWSTWISFKIDGEHSLADLATLTTHLVEGNAYRLGTEANALTLQYVLDRVGKGIRDDVYGGSFFNPQELLTVTTVLGKHTGSLSLGAMTDPAESQALKRILRSDDTTPPQKLGIALKKGESPQRDFVLHDGYSWFLWADYRLKPVERNAQKLRCYHNNTVRSLINVWLLQTFLTQAMKIKPWSAALNDLVDRVLQWLAAPPYKNFSMISFLERKDFQAARTAAQKRVSP